MVNLDSADMRPEARIAKLITYVSKPNDIKLLNDIKTMTSCPKTNLALVCNTTLFHKMAQRVNEPLILTVSDTSGGEF